MAGWADVKLVGNINDYWYFLVSGKLDGWLAGILCIDAWTEEDLVMEDHRLTLVSVR